MKNVLKAIAVYAIFIAINGCQTVPITGRSQLSLFPESTMNQMSLTNYQDFLKQNPAVSLDNVAAKRVSDVGKRISDAVTSYMNQNGLSDRISGYQWEFKLVENKEANAWCMPGGKMVVYSGILPLCKDDAGLAVVLGHEVAHAIAHHGSERMSQQMLLQLGSSSLDAALQKKPEQTRQIFLQAYGLGSQVGSLAYSRKHEYEADKLGLVFVAMAGYNPNRAIDFWKDMSNNNSGAKQPEWLSTHPSDQNRIDELLKYMPTAMNYYKAPVTPVPKTTAKKNNSKK